MNLLEKAQGGYHLKGCNFKLRGNAQAVFGFLRVMATTRQINTELSSTGYWWKQQTIKERRN